MCVPARRRALKTNLVASIQHDDNLEGLAAQIYYCMRMWCMYMCRNKWVGAYAYSQKLRKNVHIVLNYPRYTCCRRSLCSRSYSSCQAATYWIIFRFAFCCASHLWDFFIIYVFFAVNILIEICIYIRFWVYLFRIACTLYVYSFIMYSCETDRNLQRFGNSLVVGELRVFTPRILALVGSACIWFDLRKRGVEEWI